MVLKSSIKIDDKKMKLLLEIVKKNHLKANVGVLDGTKKVKDEDGEEHTIGYYGMVNEFGSTERNIPARSFLREPLQSHLKEDIEKNRRKIAKLIFEDNNIKGAYELLGLIGERIVKKSFRNKNDGKWAKNAKYTIKKKGVDNPLILTGALSKSISSEVINV